MRMRFVLVVAGSLLVLAACGPRTAYLSNADATISSSNDYFFFDLDNTDPEAGVEISLSVGSGEKDIFLIFTNPTYSSTSTPQAFLLNQTASSSPGVSGRASADSRSRSFVSMDDPIVRDAPLPRDWQPEFRTSSRGITVDDPLLSSAPQSPIDDTVGDSGSFYGLFYDGTTEYPSREFPSTLRAVEGDPSTVTEPSLSIWVEDAEWNLNGGPVTPQMVDALVDEFLNLSDGGTEIHDWLTSLYGAPWSDLSGSQYTPFTNNVTVLIHDIEDNTTGDGAGGIVGYFWSKDNYTNAALADGQPVSNERIMFYLDSETLAAGTSPLEWAPTDYWPQVAFSTLAHEFQHMIHFHQRTILRGANTPTWLNEMMSLVTEDLVADKLGVDGPRGVTGEGAGLSGNTAGRLPRYNYWNDISLAAWGGSGDVLDSYAISYAFGAYLARNYGGAQWAQALMQSSATDPDQLLVETTGLSLEGHLWRWGLATLRSQSPEPMPFRLNPGTWITSSSGGLDYRLGSINHFNYQYTQGSQTLQGPWIWSSLVSVSGMPSVSKLLYYAGTVSDGTVELSLELPTGVDVTVVVE